MTLIETISHFKGPIAILTGFILFMIYYFWHDFKDRVDNLPIFKEGLIGGLLFSFMISTVLYFGITWYVQKRLNNDEIGNFIALAAMTIGLLTLYLKKLNSS